MDGDPSRFPGYSTMADSLAQQHPVLRESGQAVYLVTLGQEAFFSVIESLRFSDRMNAPVQQFRAGLK